MLFGNNITIGEVLLKSEEVVDIIIVTDQTYEDLIIQNIENIKVVIAKSKLEPWEGPICLEWIEN